LVWNHLSLREGYIKPDYRGKKGRIINPRSIRQRDPIGDKEAFIDMGLNKLFAVVTTDGSALLIKGGSIKSEYYWWKREVSTYRAVRDLLRNAGFPHGLHTMGSTLKQCIRGMRGSGIST
jgi:transposase